MAAFLKLSQFIKKSQILHKNKKDKLWRMFGVNLKVYKFIKNLKKARFYYQKHIPNNSIRLCFGALPILQLLGSSIYKHNNK
jgi:hypothetical protein